MSTSPDTSSVTSVGLVVNAVAVMVWRVTKLVLGLGTVVGTLLYFKQDSMLYFPEIGGIPRRPSQNPRRYRSPSEHQIPFEDHRIECSDGVMIHSWLLLREEGEPTSKSRLPTIIFFHGNAGNIGLRLPVRSFVCMFRLLYMDRVIMELNHPFLQNYRSSNCTASCSSLGISALLPHPHTGFSAMQMLQYLNVNVFMVEYRGYGNSDSATPNEEGLKLDAEAALKFASHPKIDRDQIFVFGRSLGGSVAFHLAAHAEKHGLPLAGVIVENTFTSIAAMVDHLMPYIAPLKALVLRIGWNSFDIVPTLQTPILFLAGAKDQLVPHSHMLDLYKSATRSNLSKMHIVPNGTHNETWMQGGQEYFEAIRSFLSQVLDRNASQPTPEQNRGNVGNSDQEATKSSSAIPIMPSGLFGIASESIRSTSSSMDTSNKKQL